MTLRPVPDDDDRMSANPEEPRATSYEATTAPRLRRAERFDALEHFAIVARPGPLPASEQRPITRTCREPGCDNGGVMHADPRNRHPDRVMCSACQGRINGELMGTVGGGAR